MCAKLPECKVIRDNTNQKRLLLNVIEDFDLKHDELLKFDKKAKFSSVLSSFILNNIVFYLRKKLRQYLLN